jgi:hypothetical protein
MPRYQRPFLKAAQAIQRQLTRTRENSAPPPLAGESWQRLIAVHRQITMALACGWHAAARIRAGQLSDYLDEHQRAIRYFLDNVPPARAPRRLSTAAEIYRELVALQQEPFEIEIDLKARRVSVRTEPIELDSIPLGRFEIRLEWPQLPDPLEAYRIVALDPNPAASDDTVTHPHVRDERLCEGDGRAGIRSALAEGRLYDFFTIVDRLLHTYARGQAFVELSQWSGTRCTDCAAIVVDDDGSSCERCNATICCDCTSSCRHCDRVCCASCIDSCWQCEESTCPHCLEPCSQCQACVCPDCLTNQLCRDCYETESESKNNKSQPSQPVSPVADAEVYADRLGQAPVSAGFWSD